MKTDRLHWMILAATVLLAGCPEDRRPAREANPIPPAAEGADAGSDAGSPDDGGQH